MKIITTKDYEELSQLAASILLAEMSQDHRSNISITAGETPKRCYEILGERLKMQRGILDNNYFYNFDEVKSIDESEGMTIRELKRQFFEPLDISMDSVVQLTYDNYQKFDQMIDDHGGLNLMLIGLGSDGHFCGNMPHATDFNQLAYRLEFKSDYPWYDSLKEMYRDRTYPEYLVTLGLQSLLKVEHLVLIVNGKQKAKAVKRLIESSEITPAFPASGLRLHPNFTVILDQDAAALLEK